MEKLKANLKKQSKLQRMGDIDDFGLYMQFQLLSKFKMPSLPKFDGLGDPTIHIKWFLLIMTTTWLGDDQITHLLHSILLCHGTTIWKMQKKGIKAI